MNDSFCVNPFIGFEIKTNGIVAPCCKFMVNTDKNNVNNISEASINDIRQSSFFTKIKEKMLANELIKGCQTCYDEEKNGMYSKRMRDNNRFQHIMDKIKDNNQYANIKLIDLKLGNVCNLKCMICDHTSSSKWLEEKTKWDGPKWIKDKTTNKKYKWFVNKDFWDYLENSYDNIEEIGLFGGEPFLIKEQFNFINNLIEKGYSKKISLSYSTNGTIFPKKELLDIANNFKQVNIMLSIDGIEDTFEYCRFPAKWEQVSNNLLKFRSLNKINLTVAYSVSMFSIFNLPKSLEYYTKIKQPIWLNIVHDHSSIRELPNDIKENIKKELLSIPLNHLEVLTESSFNGIINYLDEPPKLNFDNILFKIKLSDKYRNNNLKKIIKGIEKYYDAT